jgi:hypothetical protein
MHRIYRISWRRSKEVERKKQRPGGATVIGYVIAKLQTAAGPRLLVRLCATQKVIGMRRSLRKRQPLRFVCSQDVIGLLAAIANMKSGRRHPVPHLAAVQFFGSLHPVSAIQTTGLNVF